MTPTLHRLPRALSLRRPAGRRRTATLCAALALTLSVSPGCTTRIHPPTDPADPITVVLVDRGHTPGLALPGAPGPALYVYGDWNYYALRNTGLWDGLRALAWPTQGALGRRLHPEPLASPATSEALRREAENLYPIRVSRRLAEALRLRLDKEFEANRATRVQTESLDLEFVHHPRQYTYFHNSNHQVRDWLLELGCDVRGMAFHSWWRVVEPAPGR
jgi:hypothetical protein